MTLDEIKRRVEYYTGVELPNKSRKLHIMNSKKVFVYLGIKHGYTREQVAEAIKCDRSNTYNMTHYIQRCIKLGLYNITQLINNIEEGKPIDRIETNNLNLLRSSRKDNEYLQNRLKATISSVKAKDLETIISLIDVLNKQGINRVNNELLQLISGLNQDDQKLLLQQGERIANRLEYNRKGRKDFQTSQIDVSVFE